MLLFTVQCHLDKIPHALINRGDKNSDKGLTNPSHCAAAFATDYF